MEEEFVRPLEPAAIALIVALCLGWGFNQVSVKLAIAMLYRTIRIVCVTSMPWFVLVNRAK